MTRPTPTEINHLNDKVTPLIGKMYMVRKMILAQEDVNDFYWIKAALGDIDDRLHELESDLNWVPAEHGGEP